LTPGIGAQGGKVRDAIKAGADYVIVGRSIYESENPREVARRLYEETLEVI
jgi:orotidine-5'-phosphate decarboxylase